MKRVEIITAILLALLAIVFGAWAAQAEYSLLAMLGAAASAGLFALCILRWLPALSSWLAQPRVMEPETGFRASRFDRRHPWLQIAAAVIAIHCLMYLLAYGVDLARHGYTGGLLDTMSRLWLRSDAPHYQGIAANWYVTEGDARTHIVFFPLYPILVRGLMAVTGNGFAAAMIISNLSAIGAAILAYELAALDMPRNSALFSALALSLFPGSLFLAAPMTESLFLLLSVGCIYLTRKGRYLLAGALGALAALTRSVGAILVIPMLLECIWDWRRGLDKEGITRRICGMALVPVGTLVYLLINYTVTGDAFAFMFYQKEHWSQQLGAFWNTAAYQLEYLISSAFSGELDMAYTLYLPNLVCCFGALGIILCGAARIRPSYTAYALLYFAISVGPTWLLSGPRYLAVCFPLALALGEGAGGKKPAAVSVAFILAAALAAYLAMFALGYYVY